MTLKFGQRVHHKKFPVITLIAGRVSLIQGFLSLKKIESVNWKKKICFPCEYNDKHEVDNSWSCSWKSSVVFGHPSQCLVSFRNLQIIGNCWKMAKTSVIYLT